MVPKGWQTKRLSDLALLIMGQSPPSSACNEDRVGLPFFQGNAEFGYIHPVAKRWISSPLKIAKKGDILISVRAPVGELNIADRDCCIGRGVGAIRTTAADRDFIYYAILDAKKKLAMVSQGSTFDAINSKQLAAIGMAVPPLPEQKKIAAILGSVDEAIQATQAIIDQTRKVKQGLLQQLLTRGLGHTRFKQTEIGEIPEGWEVVSIGELATVVTSGSRGWAKFYSDNGPLFIRSQNVRNGFLDFSDRQCVNPSQSSEGARTLVNEGDLLFTITGNGVGNVAYVPAGLGEAYVSQHVGLIRLVDPSRRVFISNFFSPDGPGNKQILDAQYGQSKPGLSLANLRNLILAYPPGAECIKIQEKITGFQRTLEDNYKGLDVLKRTKAGLMQDLLTGRVRVVDVEGVKAAV